MIDYSALTGSQTEAIVSEGSNLLVSAGAGSGKTSVLSLRVLRKLETGVSLDKLIILTFTNLAAEEMKHRIKLAIESNPDLEQQLDLVDGAMISTFDAFALRIVREYNYRLGLPDKIEIADTIVLDTLRKSCLDQAIRELYLEAPAELEPVLSRFFDRNDSRLYTAIDTIASGIEILPEGTTGYLKDIEACFHEDSIELRTAEFQTLIDQTITDLKTDFDSFYLRYMDDHNPKISAYVETMKAYYDELTRTSELTELIDFFKRRKHPQNLSKSNDIEADTLAEVKAFHNSLKSRSDEIRNLFTKLFITAKDDILNAVKDTEATVMLLARTAVRFLDLFAASKLENRIFHFSDIIRYAITLLETRPEIRKRFLEDVNEIMVDEYQDTSDLQERLLELIGNNNLFMVGDIKQSIYGFRYANPGNFRKKYHAYSRNEGGKAINLKENFRSRRQVIDCVNNVFSRIMDERIGGIDYHLDQALVFGQKAYEQTLIGSINHEPEFLCYNEESIRNISGRISVMQAEALAVKNDILEKLGSGYTVLDRKTNKLRKATFRDFAILADRKSSFQIFQDTLVKAAIPVEVFSEEYFSLGEEIEFVWQFLRLVGHMSQLDTPYSEYASDLIGLARSFVYRIKDDTIVSLLLDSKGQAIGESLRLVESVPEIKAITDTALAIASALDRLPLPELLENIYARTGIFDHIAALDNPGIREKKLSYLHEKSRAFATRGFKAFLTYFDSVYQNKDFDIEFVDSESRFDDTVKIMSMHKAKGLEYPICYYIGLDKRFNYTDNRNFVIFDREYGIVTKAFHDGFQDTILHVLMNKKNYREYVSERIRLFYVALTRAREKQIFVVNTDNVVPYSPRMNNKGYVDPEIRSRFHSYADLLSCLDLADVWFRDADFSFSDSRQRVHPELSEPNRRDYRQFQFEPRYAVRKTLAKAKDKLLTEAEKEAIANGETLHNVLEHFDFSDLDNSLAAISEELGSKVKKLVSSKPFSELSKARIYQEYPFTWENDGETISGVIDLLIIRDDIAYVIDYKLKDTTDPAYANQLEGYAKYVGAIARVPVETYLYSLISEKLVRIGERP